MITMNNPTPAIAVRGLLHRFKDRKALDDVNFTVGAGELHGFVGPNGAGKTTALKLICTLLVPQRGNVSVFGHDVVRDVHQVRRLIGFMPDHFSMYRQMTVFEYLDFFGAAYGHSVASRNRIIKDVLELTDMDARQNSMINGLSRGMQQRVSLARVLVNDPALLLLDEPASGLDPRARIELMDILRALQGMGKTVFISSHILSELAELCDSVTIIDRGHIKYSGPMEELLNRDQGEQVVLVTLAAAPDDAVAQLEYLAAAALVEKVDGKGEFRVTLAENTDTNQLVQEIIGTGLTIRSINPERRHLNQAFMDLTQGGVA